MLFRWFETRIDPFPSDEPTKPPAGLIAFCLHYSRPVWKVLAIMSLLTTAISIMEVMLFAFMGQLVDWLAEADRVTFLADEGPTLILMALVILVLLPLAIFVNSMIIHQSLLGNFPMILRWQAHRYLLGQSLAFFQDEFAGRVATKVMQSSLAVREVALKVLEVLLYVVVYFTGMVVLVASSDLRMTAPLLAWLVAYIAALWFFLPRLQAVSKRQADARSLMTGRVVDSYTNIQTVKLFSHAGRELGYARDSMEGFLETVNGQMRLSTALQITLSMMNALLLFSVAAVSIWLWLQGDAGLGAVAVAIGLVLRLSGMSQWIMWEVSSLFENIGTVQDGITTLAQSQDVTDGVDAKPLVVEQGEVVFDQVRFHYGKAEGVIEDFSLTIKPGEKIGLVGRSGAGKSTIVNLLLRFYDIEGGRILIDGQDIARVTQESLRAQIGMVTQDTSLLHRSVRENILYGRPDAGDEAMQTAARKAEADLFIEGLSDPSGRLGYDAHVGERGVKLSGGQRQRIAITRVLLKDAPILLLDEATSALDSEVEAAIQQSLYRLMAGKTVIAIAHRLSTIAAMDRLIVLDHGKIVEEGRHDDLVEAGGVYASLWQRQSGGFIDATQAA
ncbi:MAG: ABC transporter ATP-binding protein, partial [Geminicoccaceae bacterium]